MCEQIGKQGSRFQMNNVFFPLSRIKKTICCEITPANAYTFFVASWA